jgi:CCR4-NOT transcription complex subunit 1
VLPQIHAQSLSLLPPNHELRQFSRQIVLLAGQSIPPDEQALAFSQKVVQYLFKTQLQIGREMYVSVLDHLCQSFPKVAKEAIDWLLNAEDEVSGSLSPT